MERTRHAVKQPITDYVYACNSLQPLATIPLAFEDFDAPLIGDDMAAAPHYEAVVEVAAVHSAPSVAAAAAAAASGTAASGRGHLRARPQAAKKRGAAADADTAAQKRLRAQPHLQVLTRNTIHTPLAYCVVRMYCY